MRGPKQPDGDREAQLDFAAEMLRANDEDVADEAFFYQETPEFFSLADPKTTNEGV